MTPIIPALEELQKQGEAGRTKLNQYQYYLTIPLTLLQAYGQVSVLQAQYKVIAPENFGFTAQAVLPTISTLLTLTAGTMFAIWLGELITNDGIGNGLSIIIFGGIVANIPGRLAALWQQQQWVELATFVLVTVLTIAGDRVRAGRTAPHPGAVWQAGAGYARQPAARGGWTEHSDPAARELGGDDPADLGAVAADVPGGDRVVSARGADAVGEQRGAAWCIACLTATARTIT